VTLGNRFELAAPLATIGAAFGYWFVRGLRSGRTRSFSRGADFLALIERRNAPNEYWGNLTTIGFAAVCFLALAVWVLISN
jgi:hypothetical protein